MNALPAEVKLSPGDAAFFAGESELAPQVTALLTLLDRAPRLDALKEAAIRGAEFLPRMRYVKDPHRFGILIPARSINFDAHVRSIYVPGVDQDAQLSKTIAVLHSKPLPCDRPLWEFLLISNRHPQTGVLAPGERERAAVLWRMHHGLSDGIRSLNVFRAMLSPGSAPDAISIERIGRPTKHSFVARVAATARTIVRTSSMTPIPSPLNGKGSSARAFTPVELDRASLRSVMSQYSASLHEVVLGALASTLRLHHMRCGAQVSKDLRIMVPSNSRPVPRLGTEGNFIDLLWVSLPISESDPVARLRKTSEALARARTEGWIEFSEAFPPLLARLPLSVQRKSIHTASVLTNAVCTILPAAIHKLELDGQSIRHSYAAASLLAGHGAGFTFITAGDAVRGAIISDPHILPDPARLAASFVDSVYELAGGRTIPVNA